MTHLFENTGLREEVISSIISNARTCQLDMVILFGSRAKGTFSPKSDVDLAIKGGDVAAYREAMDEQCPTLLQFDIIDLGQPLGEDLRKRIAEEGIALYG